MSSSSTATISKEAMVASFPAKIPSIEGEITLKELLRVFQHLIACAQSTVTSHDALSFLYLVVPATLWGLYSAAAHLQAPRNQGNIPPYHLQNTPLQNKVTKQAWLVATKY